MASRTSSVFCTLGRHPVTPAAFALLAAALAFSCGRSSRTSDDDHAKGHGGSGATDSGGTAGAATGGVGRGGSGATGAEGGAGGEPDPTCARGNPPTALLRRLTRLEYDNTVRDLFDDTTEPAETLPDDTGQNARDISAAEVEGYHRLAHDFALGVTMDDATANAFIGCDPESDGEATCRDAFIQDFVTLAFRRPATSDELDDFSTVFENGQTLGESFRSGVRAVVEVALQSPEFLYRVELGEPADDIGPGWARPTSHEMASRLSYFFWSAPPDRALLDSARGNGLLTPEEVETQARRLLASDRARDMVGSFYLRLLALRDAAFPAAGNAAFPSFTPEIAELMLEETRAFTSDVTLGGEGDFETLLTAPFTFVNGPLAEHYGLPGVSGNAFVRVDGTPARRAGLLTQGSFLAATSNETWTDPYRRGFLVASAFLCSSVPSEPPVPMPTPPAPEPGKTTRDRVAEETGDAACQGCHATINPLGLAFENYDPAGLFRDTENGVVIDASGQMDELGSFDGALALAERLSASEDARRCFVRSWFAFAHDRSATPDDECSLESLDRAFASHDQNLRELLVALTQTDAFLYRPAVTP